MMKALPALSIILFLLSCHASAQFPVSLGQPSPPFQKFLDTHGGGITIHTGSQVRRDKSAWEDQTNLPGVPEFDPSPHQPSSGQHSGHWDKQFTLPDVMGTVYAIAVNGTDVYVGGHFIDVAGTGADGIARWDGSNWFAVGPRLSPKEASAATTVRALAVNGSDVYIAGSFQTGGVFYANGIAKWDGSTWTVIGATSATEMVSALAVSGGYVYAGGRFTQISGIPATNIARWNGSTWDSLSAGVGGSASGSISSMAVINSDLYVGGSFDTAGGVMAHNVARWNGVSWDSLGSGISGVSTTVTALAVRGTDLYALKVFPGFTAMYACVLKWNGSVWDSSSGLLSHGQSWSALAVIDSSIYVGGLFDTAGGMNVHNIARWNGLAWDSLGGGILKSPSSPGPPIVTALAVSGNDLFVGGLFLRAGGANMNGIAKWNGSSWLPLHGSGTHQGVNDGVSALAATDSFLYAGGQFTQAGGVDANHIAKFDGTSWHPLGTGINGNVNAIAVNGSNVYVGGYFTNAGGVSVNNIAKWDGNSWSALGTGVNGWVSAIAIGEHGDVFVGAGSGVERWNGSTWSIVGGPINYGQIMAIAISGSTVYAGGSFSSIGGVSANNIAAWNGTTWVALGNGLNGYGVRALAASGGNLYAGTAGGGVWLIEKWNGTSWSPLASTSLLSEQIYDFLTVGSSLYACGSFTYGGRDLTVWNGTDWSGSQFGLGFFWGYGQVLATYRHDLYIGGTFLMADTVPSGCLARWDTLDVSALVPDSGTIGSSVKIIGGEFDTLPANNVVTFGVLPATVTSAKLDTLTVTVPALATTSFISVTTRGITALSNTQFTVVNPSFSPSPPEIFFGSVPANSSKSIGLTVTNPGTGPLVITSASSNDPGLTVVPTQATVPPSGNANFTVTLSPLTPYLAKTDTLTFVDNTGGSPERILCTASGTSVQPQDSMWAWAKSSTGGGTLNDIAVAVAVDGMGNSYVAGYFNSPTLTFGSFTLSTAGSYDIYVVKYDPSGNVLWARSAGGTGEDHAQGTAVDGSGNCYVSGYFFSDSVKFGPTTLKHESLYTGNSDIFLVKYDPFGNVLWATNSIGGGGSNIDNGSTVAMDGSGNSYVAGGYGTPTIQFGQQTMTNTGGSDLFIVKFDPEGNALWLKGSTGAGDDWASGVAADSAGNSFVVGFSNSTILQFGPDTLKNSGYNDAYIAKYDPYGNILWARCAGETDNDYATGVGLDSSGNSYVIGRYQSSSIRFGLTTLTNAAAGYPDIFVVKYDQSGNVLWAKGSGGTDRDYAVGVATDRSGNSYVVGDYQSSSFQLQDTTLSNAGPPNADVFLVKYDGFGNVLWVKGAGGLFRDWGSAVALDKMGNCFIAGLYYSTSIPFGPTTLTNAGSTSSDMYLAKIGSSALPGYSAIAGGWNMISVPNIVSDRRTLSIYPNASSVAFAYVGGYQRQDTLKNGLGYWLKFDAAGAVYYNGIPVSRETVAVTPGWNMVGSISLPIPVSSITSVPGGMVVSMFFGYSSGYSISDSILPGKAYWVHVNDNGSLVLSSSGSQTAASRIHVRQTSELPPPPPDGKAVDAGRGLPAEFGLEQNYPNPFNPATVIRYQLPTESRVKLSLHNVLGQQVSVLVDGVETAGYKSVGFDAASLSSGVYYYKLTAGRFSRTMKMLVLK